VSKFLPDVYTIRGLRAAQGFIFKDVFSAYQWLNENLKCEWPEHIKVLPAEVIYYGSNLTVDMKSSEQMLKEKA